MDPNAKKEDVSKTQDDHIAKRSTDEVMRVGACRRDTLSPFSELPCDMWAHVLEFLSPLAMHE